MEPPSFQGSGQKTKPWSLEGPSLLIPGPQILGVWKVVLKSIRVQGSFWTWWLHGSVTGWVMWRRAGSEEAAGPGRCPTQKPYLSLTMATLVTSWLGLPWAQPCTPRISSDYRTAHIHERGDTLSLTVCPGLAAPAGPPPGARGTDSTQATNRPRHPNRRGPSEDTWQSLTGDPEARGCPWVLQGTGGRADRDQDFLMLNRGLGGLHPVLASGLWGTSGTLVTAFPPVQ